MDIERSCARLRELDREIVLASHVVGVLQWDQEVLPEAAADERSRQLGWLEAKLHALVVSDEMGDLLASIGCSADHPYGDSTLGDLDAALVRIRWEEYDRERKLDESFVKRFAETTGKAHHIWVAARATNDFASYQPVLAQIVEMVREKATRYGYEHDPYDALLRRFEPGVATSTVQQVFSVMAESLRRISQEVSELPSVDDSFLRQHFPVERQAQFGKEVLEAMGFDFNRGLTATSVHPFTTTLGEDDVRLTTRYTDVSMASPLFSTIHEGGHALYEQGASWGNLRGTSLASAASLGMHESQSRMWENMVARSHPFWIRWFPRLKELFPSQLEGVDASMFVSAINRVQPSCIRVDADEVTYGLHIVLRFELERSLLAGCLEVQDLPDAWNDGMQRLLGIRPTSIREGVLQDVHWSMGELGYFPTYALGNLYAAQLMERMRSDFNVDASILDGNLSDITQWLRQYIHTVGAAQLPGSLLRNVTGKDLDPNCFERYLVGKYLGRVSL